MDPSLPRSRVECLGADRCRCGYCRGQFTSANFGAWAHSLDVRDYQALLDAGWRRSGSYIYRPDLVATCCPSYVIRLDASRFKPSSTQKRVLKRLRRFASSENALSPSSSSVSASSSMRVADPPRPSGTVPVEKQASASAGALLEYRQSVSSAISGAIDAIFQSPQDAALFPPKTLVDPLRSTIKVYPPRAAGKSKKGKAAHVSDGQSQAQSSSNSFAPQFTSNVALLLASAERKARHTVKGTQADIQSRARARRRGEEMDEEAKLAKLAQVQRQMELATILARYLRRFTHELGKVVVTEPGFLNFRMEQDSANDDLMHEGISAEKCMEIDRVNPTNLSERLHSDMKGVRRIRVSLAEKAIPLSRIGSDASSDKTVSPLEVPSHIAPDSSQVSEGSSERREARTSRGNVILQELFEGKAFTMELVPAEYRAEAYEIFRKYQMTVHRERPHQCTADVYKRFLVESPLIESCSSADPEQRYGSFHMQYRMSGRLFAVGVVDVLPRCLSSVYLFYDPEFAKLSPGTLSAVKEIEWVKRASVLFPSLQFYYMGYYIHSCSKMRYKAAFYPSEILCEETKNWVPASDAQRVLDASSDRRLRLAPQSLPLTQEAEDFRIDEQEMEVLTGDTKLQISFEGEGVRILPYRMLDGLLHSRYPEQMEALRRKIRMFVGLVGKKTSKFYLHVL